MAQPAVARDVKLFSSTPLLFLLAAWMWGMSKLGFSWPVLRMLQRAMLRKRNGLRDNAIGSSVCLGKPWL